MTGFLEITKIELPLHCIERAYEFMRYVGKKHLEGAALFVGKEDENIFSITEVIIPKQTALSIEQGLMYSVSGDELYRLNVYLFENNLSLIAQIHSHPQHAYHSETDDAFPIITTVGGLSIVVPNFASDPINVELWAVYRLSINNFWEELSVVEQKRLIIIS